MTRAVTRAGGGQAANSAGRNPAPLTSFVGRSPDIAAITALLDDQRLVTITGPGGVGKTRLAIEVARRVADRFPDGAWFVDLGAVTNAGQVPAEVTSVLGLRQDPGRPALESLAAALAPRRLLLVLDNCEHVRAAVADLCGALLGDADEVRVLATSRERIGVGAEAAYRLFPLQLPASGEPAAVDQSAAAALFIERARLADPRFALGPEHAPLVARVVTRLDGIPLAIELAAARIEALGIAGLADRIDDALRLLAGGDPTAADRHRSLTAVADWSYELLAEPERRVFRRLAVFPGPFTLEAAEAVAGAEAGPVVLRLVDCSLLVPPRPGPDQRTRYTMLQTLRAYTLTRLREAGEEQQAMAALTAFAQSVAGQAAAARDASDGELGALRWLDAEDATLGRALGWALEHDPAGALRLATAVVQWLRRRGRLADARDWLTAAVRASSLAESPAAEPLPADSPPAGETWAKARILQGYLSSESGDPAAAADHDTAAIEVYRDRAPSPVLVEALAAGRAIARLNLGDFPGALDDARRALALARELGDATGELLALTALGVIAYYAGDAAGARGWVRQARELLPSDVPGHVARYCHYIAALVLTEMDETGAARQVCGAGLALARQAEDLPDQVTLLGVMADLECLAGNVTDAGRYLREAIGLASRIGYHQVLINLVEQCGNLCAVTGRMADALTLWAAFSADRKRRGQPNGPVHDRRRAEYMRRAGQVLEPGPLREAQDRGARMPASAAVELALMATAAVPDRSPGPEPGKLLSPRERELVTLVAQGRTNAEIAARLYISVRTVASHLDRIRDKTGYRRRADLTRLAVEENLV